jgi:osmotically-inducible protein OsmY
MEMIRKRRVEQQVKSVPRQAERSVQHELDARLREYLFHAGRQVSCEFHEGVVILRGHVGSFHDKQMAQELARKVDGVKIVVNRLVVDSFAAGKVAGAVLPSKLNHQPCAIGAE